MRFSILIEGDDRFFEILVNINQYLEEWKAGHDPHDNIVGLIDDPDAVDGQKERCSIDNVWFKGTFYNSMMKKTLNYLFYL